jgi:hypothetical protein
VKKYKGEPYASMYRNILQEEKRLSKTASGVYEVSTLAKYRSFIYLLTEEKSWVNKVYDNMLTLLADTVFVKNPLSKGLTRAHVLREFVYAYDFVFEGLTVDQRQMVSNALYDLMSSVNNNMGRMANYNIESNWMGVRYGSVVFAASVLDQVYLDQSSGAKNVKAFCGIPKSDFRIISRPHLHQTDGLWNLWDIMPMIGSLPVRQLLLCKIHLHLIPHLTWKTMRLNCCMHLIST